MDFYESFDTGAEWLDFKDGPQNWVVWSAYYFCYFWCSSFIGLVMLARMCKLWYHYKHPEWQETS